MRAIIIMLLFRKCKKGIGFIKKAASAVGNTILKVLQLPAYAAMSLINICRHKTAIRCPSVKYHRIILYTQEMP